MESLGSDESSGSGLRRAFFDLREHGLTRRGLFEVALAIVAFTAGRLWTRPPSPLESVSNARSLHDRLGLLLDVLIPDGEFPGHRATNVLPTFLQRFGPNAGSIRFVSDTFDRLDSLARARGARSFDSLGPEDRRLLVLELDKELFSSGFRLIRDEAMHIHYSHPIVWARLGFRHSPQPLGYMDFFKSPDASIK